jgi:hypothetical protein
MRIPFKVTTKGMENTDKAGSKIFRFIQLVKHAEDTVADRMKEAVKKGTVIQEKDTKLFGNSENTMTMEAGNELAGHGKGTLEIILVPAGRAETALTAEGDKFKVTTMRAAPEDTAMGRVSAMNHLIYILNNGRPGMKFVNDMFIIIGENLLKFIHKSILQ